jgi:hypothetical protein
MRAERRNPLFQKRLHAEVRRILQLLERTRRTRGQARLLIALENRASRRKPGPGSARTRLGRYPS